MILSWSSRRATLGSKYVRGRNPRSTFACCFWDCRREQYKRKLGAQVLQSNYLLKPMRCLLQPLLGLWMTGEEKRKLGVQVLIATLVLLIQLTILKPSKF
ncbi:hypothetical protein ACFX1X_014246 [Malus domestica]